jgi:DNA-binding transcriptional MerR regulator/methylmalonyl-CoA mutase cobalamin-binding subunit
MSDLDLLRIGELSRRSGVSPELLRAWERRYGLLRPTRSAGGLRLYTAADLDRVRVMQRHLAEGLAAAEAAALATQSPGDAVEPTLDPATARRALEAALSAFDEAQAQALLDGVFAGMTLDSALSAVVLPYLHDLGERWARGDASVAEEHFAAGIVRGRLLGLARGWGRGFGPRVLLACAPGEQHDLGLVAFGLALRTRGWRILYLGADAPVESILGAADASEPDFVVVSAVSSERFAASGQGLREVGDRHTLGIAGAGASEATAAGLGAISLGGDPVEEAERLSSLVETPGARR